MKGNHIDKKDYRIFIWNVKFDVCTSLIQLK